MATKILGNGADPEFADAAPAGGILVGFEIGLGKFANRDNVAAARPIYRVGAEEKLGNQYGTNTTRVVRVMAKPGYAVGAITVRQDLAIAGMSITFMKINNGRLDPADSYESEWLGGTGGGQPVRVGSTGTPAIGIVGRNNKTNMSGIGLLLQP